MQSLVLCAVVAIADLSFAQRNQYLPPEPGYDYKQPQQPFPTSNNPVQARPPPQQRPPPTPAPSYGPPPAQGGHDDVSKN